MTELDSFLDSVNKIDQVEANKHVEVKAESKLPHVSHSQIQTYTTCGLQYYFSYVLRLPRQKYSGSSFGSTMHKLLETFLLSIKEEKKIIKSDQLKDMFKSMWTTAAQDEEIIYSTKDGDFDNLLQKGYKFCELIVPEFKMVDVVDVEKDFSLPIRNIVTGEEIKGVTLNGQIDLIKRHQNGTMEIEDHKFVGQKYAQGIVDTNEQATTYAYAFRELYGEQEAGITFNCFTKTKEPKLAPMSTTRNQDDITWMFKYYKEAIRGINNNDWVPKRSEKCGFCSFAQECREWGTSFNDADRAFRITRE